MSQRLEALSLCEGWQRDGLLYQWGGKLQGDWRNYAWRYGADCSGIASGALYIATSGRYDWREMWNADRFHHQLPVTLHPEPGDAAVYGTPERATHIMLVVGDGRVIGACGGGPETKTEALARARGARVQFRPRADYRRRRTADGRLVSDFLGFRKLPFAD
jgi:cell wall-associated NlpC family hydrolase